MLSPQKNQSPTLSVPQGITRQSATSLAAKDLDIVSSAQLISLFHNLFDTLLTSSEKIAHATNPDEHLAALLLMPLKNVFPTHEITIDNAATALAILRKQGHTSSGTTQTATEQFEKLNLSATITIIENLFDYPLILAQKQRQLYQDGYSTTGGAMVLCNAMRRNAIDGLKFTLCHTGTLGADGIRFDIPLYSHLKDEPYHALSALQLLARLDTDRSGKDLRCFFITAATTDRAELAEKLKNRYQTLKPQVYTLLENILTNISRELIKEEPPFLASKTLQKHYEEANWDPISFLNVAPYEEDAKEILNLRKSILQRMEARIFTERLHATLASWEALPAQIGERNQMDPDIIDGIVAIRQIQKGVPWPF